MVKVALHHVVLLILDYLNAHQLFMRTLLNLLALLHHDDVVAIPDGRQSVRDHYRDT